MKALLALLLLGATTATAQDTSFARLGVRVSAFRVPVAGALSEDWRAKTGGQLELASNVGPGEVSVGVARIAFAERTGKPPFTETMVSFSWTVPLLRVGRLGIDGGGRLADVQFDFDDPAMVPGLRTEKEMLFSGMARGRVAIGNGVSAVAEASYGILMLSTNTPTAMVSFGIERAGRTPRWLRDFLR
jgi:hypothetical protein